MADPVRKTYGQLSAQTGVENNDLIATFRGVGPLKTVTALDFKNFVGSGTLLASNNLSDLSNLATARTNLSVYSIAQVDTITGGLQTSINGKATLNADVAFRDITASRGDGSGAIILGDTLHYIFWDGVAYQMPNGILNVNAGVLSGGSAVWTAATLPMATASQYRANTAGNTPLTPNAVWSAATFVSLTQAATIAVDMNAGINFTTTMTGNRTLGAPTNAKPGQSGVIEILQDGTGGRTLAYASAWVFAGGVDPVLSTGANARDVLAYTVISSSIIVANLIKAVA